MQACEKEISTHDLLLELTKSCRDHHRSIELELSKSLSPYLKSDWNGFGWWLFTATSHMSLTMFASAWDEMTGREQRKGENQFHEELHRINLSVMLAVNELESLGSIKVPHFIMMSVVKFESYQNFFLPYYRRRFYDWYRDLRNEYGFVRWDRLHICIASATLHYAFNRMIEPFASNPINLAVVKQLRDNQADYCNQISKIFNEFLQ